MFIGETRHSIDAKGRVMIPSKFRTKLGDRFIITKGLDGCLFIYTLEEWNKFEEKLKNLPFSSKDARQFTRFFLAGAEECELDSQGRILVPQSLREYAKLEKEVISIGVSNRIEIWNVETWEGYNSNEDFNADEIAEKMTILGI